MYLCTDVREEWGDEEGARSEELSLLSYTGIDLYGEEGVVSEDLSLLSYTGVGFYGWGDG